MQKQYIYNSAPHLDLDYSNENNSQILYIAKNTDVNINLKDYIYDFENHKFTFSLDKYTLPSGLTYKNGIISGKTNSLSDGSFTITLKDSEGASITKTVTVNVVDSALIGTDEFTIITGAKDTNFKAPTTENKLTFFEIDDGNLLELIFDKGKVLVKEYDDNSLVPDYSEIVQLNDYIGNDKILDTITSTWGVEEIIYGEAKEVSSINGIKTPGLKKVDITYKIKSAGSVEKSDSWFNVDWYDYYNGDKPIKSLKTLEDILVKNDAKVWMEGDKEVKLLSGGNVVLFEKNGSLNTYSGQFNFNKVKTENIVGKWTNSNGYLKVTLNTGEVSGFKINSDNELIQTAMPVKGQTETLEWYYGVDLKTMSQYYNTISNSHSVTIKEGSTKIFDYYDFYFTDDDIYFEKIIIKELPNKGKLTLNNIEVKINQEIDMYDISTGKLKFTPKSNEFGQSYSSFKFKVVDYDTSKVLLDDYVMSFNVLNKNGNYSTTGVSLTGTSGNDTLTGGAGNDILDGKAGIDTMIGGKGNDTYYVDNVKDVVTEKASEGTDTVISSKSYTLTSNVENLTLTGSGVIDGIGNTLNNKITGNSNNNKLNGGLGNDTLYGLAGHDTLNGGIGNDTMLGGKGNDTYYVDNVKDVVTELASEGTDLVNSSITYTLTANVENLTLTGTSAINGTGNSLNNKITGNSGNNVLNGGAGDDIIYGGNGNDTLNGGSGADNMTGGNGNDTYYVDNIKDKITEYWTTTGIDSVFSSVSYALTGVVDRSILMGFSNLATSVENLTLTGNTAKTALGNNLNNIITGNSADNFLNGFDGSDTYIGGLGKDTFVINRNLNTIDKIKDFNVKDDTIYLVNLGESNSFSIASMSKAAKVLNKDYFRANSDGLAKDSNDFYIYETDTGKLFYDADGNGSGKSKQIALIENKASLTYADFVVL